MVDIIQIDNNTWRIEDNFVRFFLLTGEEKALLIDSGANTPNAKEIAEILCLSINTIKTHNKRIYMKLNVASRRELLLYVEMLKEAGKEFK